MLEFVPLRLREETAWSSRMFIITLNYNKIIKLYFQISQKNIIQHTEVLKKYINDAEIQCTSMILLFQTCVRTKEKGGKI